MKPSTFVQVLPAFPFLQASCRRIKTVLYTAIATLALLVSQTPFQAAYAEAGQTEAQTPAASVSVNINTDSVEEIAAALIGVGIAKAEAIVEYREQHGPFTDKSQLTNVKGIGEATLQKNISVIEL